MSKKVQYTLNKIKTVRAKKVAQVILNEVERGGEVPSVSKVMREVGYAPNYAKNPQKLTRQKGFLEIFEQAGMTSDFLAKKHRKLANLGTLHDKVFYRVEKNKFTDKDIEKLVAKFGGEIARIDRDTIYESQMSDPSEDDAEGARPRFERVETNYEDIRVFYIMPDTNIQRAMLELAYKLRGDLVERSESKHLGVHINLNEEKRSKLDDILKENQ